MKEPEPTEERFQPVPVTVVGGFLGAGKTSLLNHILSNVEGKRVAALINDFGEINIDAKLIVSVEGETISLANGCVCCIMRDDLVTEILKLFEREPIPEHIVVETSGVSKPLGVVETFLNPSIQYLVEVQSLITVIDADLVIDDEAEYRPLAIDQIRYADVAVINKTDLVETDRLESVKSEVMAIAPRSRIWETTFGEVPLDLFFSDRLSTALEAFQTGSDGDHHHEHHPDQDFAAWSYRSDEAWSFGALQRAIQDLPDGIYRSKGIVGLDIGSDDYGILQVTGKRGWLRLMKSEDGGKADVSTELVFIGKPGSTSSDAIRDHFEQALADDRAGKELVVSDLRAFSVIFT
jgi:G3E family GTPase